MDTNLAVNRKTEAPVFKRTRRPWHAFKVPASGRQQVLNILM